jgi:hypothetical protein
MKKEKKDQWTPRPRVFHRFTPMLAHSGYPV